MDITKVLNIVRSCPGVRTVQISDRLDCNIEDLSETLDELVAGGQLQRKEVIGPNQRKAIAYWVTDNACGTSPATSVPAEREMTKVEKAISTIKENGGAATSSQLHAALGLAPNELASQCLVDALRDGRLVKDGKFWTLNDGKVADAPLPDLPIAAPVIPAQDAEQAPTTKVAKAIEYLAKHGLAKTSELKAALGLKAHPQCYFAGAVDDGRITRDGDFWMLGKEKAPPRYRPPAVTRPEPVVRQSPPIEVPQFLTGEIPAEPMIEPPVVNEKPAEPALIAHPPRADRGPIKVGLIEEPMFTIQIGTVSIPCMRLVSEWNGMKELRDMQGRTLIVLVDAVASPVVIKGSPDLIFELAEVQ